jgi:hypothetical protein
LTYVKKLQRTDHQQRKECNQNKILCKTNKPETVPKRNFEYLVDLREKFLQQEYPLAVINSQFKRALEVDRLDLIFGNPALRKNKKKKVVAPLILTYNPSNPPVKTWIKEGMEILHKDPKLKKVSKSRCSFQTE